MRVGQPHLCLDGLHARPDVQVLGQRLLEQLQRAVVIARVRRRAPEVAPRKGRQRAMARRHGDPQHVAHEHLGLQDPPLVEQQLGGVGLGEGDGDVVADPGPQLPDIDGFEVARRLMQLDAPPTVVLTSSRDAVDYGSRVSDAAARGFIGKAELTAERLAALVGHAA